MRSILVCLTVFSFPCWVAASVPDSYRGCERDSDCVFIQPPCACNRIPDVVNKKFLKDDKSSLKIYGLDPSEMYLCPAVVCTQTEEEYLRRPVCAAGLCDVASRSISDESLTEAARYDHVDVVQARLAEGVQANQKDENSYTALMWAAINNNIEMLQVLLAHGADPNVKAYNGNPILMLPDVGKKPNLVRLLLEHGLNPNSEDKQGNTFLSYAEDNSICELLIEKGANINSNDGTLTPLMRAIRSHRTDLIKFYLVRGAKLNIIAKRSGFLQEPSSALTEAVVDRDTDTAHLLLQHGADVNTHSKYAESSLDLAVGLGNLDMMRGSAVHSGTVEMIKLLQKYGACRGMKTIQVAPPEMRPLLKTIRKC